MGKLGKSFAAVAVIVVEMLLVLEGRLGQADAAILIGLAKPEHAVEPAELASLIETLRGPDSRWIVSGLLLMVDADSYATHGDFVRESLRHTDEVVRETALEVFLAHESGRDAVAAQSAPGSTKKALRERHRKNRRK